MIWWGHSHNMLEQNFKSENQLKFHFHVDNIKKSSCVEQEQDQKKNGKTRSKSIG